MKYRIKLQNKRIIGPFDEKKIAELFIKGYISGTEDCQDFPNGDWKKITEFSRIDNLINKIINQDLSASDIDISSSKVFDVIGKERKKLQDEFIEKEFKTSPKVFEEFKFKKDSTRSKEILIPKDENEKFDLDEEKESTLVNDKKEESITDEESSGLDATRVNYEFKKFPLKEETEEINYDALSEDEVQTQMVNKEELIPISSKDETVVADVNDLLPQLKIESKQAEYKLISLKDNDGPDEEDEIKTIIQTKKDENKRKPIVVAIIILLGVYFLLPDGQKIDKPYYYAKLRSPVIYEVENINTAEKALNGGRQLYNKGDYVSLLKASTLFRESVQNKFKENPAFGYMMMSYAKLLPDVQDQVNARNVVFNLIKLSKGRELSDDKIAYATALFFYHSNKYQNSVSALENFLRLEKPTEKIVALLLRSYVAVGDLVSAEKVYDNLKKGKLQNSESYLALAEFSSYNAEYEDEKKYLKLGIEKNQLDLRLWFKLAENSVVLGDKERLRIILKKISDAGTQRSPTYFSKYLEQMGMLNIFYEDFEKAAILFEKALKIKDSEFLRAKLAKLTVGGSERVKSLIVESKAKELIRKSKEAMRNLNWEKAILLAVDASELSSESLESQLHLGRILVKQGFYLKALKNYERLYKKHPDFLEVNVEYTKGLLDSFQLEKADKHLVNLSTSSKVRNTAHYDYLLGYYYLKKGNFLQTVRWFRNALEKDPLRDDIHKRLAEIFLRNRKYKSATYHINNAIELDPTNPDYKVINAKILYEKDDLDTALGYLRKTLKENPDDVKILSEIAILYYKSGKTKDFERVKKRIQNSPKKTENLYKFLMQVSQLEEKESDVIKYAKEVIRIKPGDLKTRIELSIYLYQRNRYADAKLILKDIEKKLPSYPKLNYYLGKISFIKNNVEEAINYANKEIEYLPNSEWGYVLLGEIYTKTKRFTEAQAELKKALQINRKSVDSLMALAWIKYHQNYIDEALALYRRAEKEDSGNPIVHKQLGYIYKAKGQGRLARSKFKVYLELFPNARDKEVIERLMKQLE